MADKLHSEIVTQIQMHILPFSQTTTIVPSVGITLQIRFMKVVV